MANKTSNPAVIINGKRNRRELQSKKKHYNTKLILTFVASFLIALVIAYMAYIYFNSQAKITRYIKDNEFPEAIQLINQLLKENPSDAFALKSKGEVYFYLAMNQDMFSNEESNTPEHSINSLKRLLLTKNKDYIHSDTFFFLGANYFLMGDSHYEESLKYLEQAIKLDSKDNRVKEYFKKQGFKIRLNKTVYSVTFYGLVAYVAFSLERYHLAVAYFEKAIKENNAVTIYHLFLARAYRQQNIFDKALEELEIVIHREKQQDVVEQAYLSMAEIYYHKKEYSQSEKYIKLAQKMNPSAETFYQLGMIYETQGQIAIAIKHWKKALKLDGEFDPARKKLIRYERKFKR